MVDVAFIKIQMVVIQLNIKALLHISNYVVDRHAYTRTRTSTLLTKVILRNQASTSLWFASSVNIATTDNFRT